MTAVLETGKPSIEYARPDLEVLTIRDEKGVLSVLVPPMSLKRFAWRAILWSLALLGLAVAVAARVLPRAVVWSKMARFLKALAAYASMLPLALLLVLLVFVAYMLARIVLYRAIWARLAMDRNHLEVDNPTGFLRRRRLSLDRLRKVDLGEAGTLWIHLRDGIACGMSLEDKQSAIRASEAIDAFLKRRSEGITRATPPILQNPLDQWTGAKPWCGAKNWPKVQFTRFANGLRINTVRNDAYFMLYIVRAGFVLWLTCAVLMMFVTIDISNFIQWTLAYAVVCLILFRPRTEKNPPAVSITCADGSIWLDDPEFIGSRNVWSGDEIESIRVAGPMWWVFRVGRLRVRLRNGDDVTLLDTYPVAAMQPIAWELRKSLFRSDATS